LQAARVPGPYVLVGHSLGGLFVRLYAATYPEEVVGLVEVDALCEGLETLLTPADWAAYARLNAAVPPELADYTALETLDFTAASATMRRAAAAQPLPPLPLVVLAHGQPFGLTEEELGLSPDALERAWRAAQEELAGLTPTARFVVATESGHYIQLQQPELVTDAVRQVVDELRQTKPRP
jgi:pimeloyl-ACP methyl ester carboxylesterase